jgi:hypothetical protein
MVNKQYTIRDTQSELLKYAIRHTFHASRNMQNKPNYKKGKMNVSAVKTKDYGNSRLAGYAQNKPNQTQFFSLFVDSQGICSRLVFSGKDGFYQYY